MFLQATPEGVLLHPRGGHRRGSTTKRPLSYGDVRRMCLTRSARLGVAIAEGAKPCFESANPIEPPTRKRFLGVPRRVKKLARGFPDRPPRVTYRSAERRRARARVAPRGCDGRQTSRPVRGARLGPGGRPQRLGRTQGVPSPGSGPSPGQGAHPRGEGCGRDPVQGDRRGVRDFERPREARQVRPRRFRRPRVDDPRRGGGGGASRATHVLRGDGHPRDGRPRGVVRPRGTLRRLRPARGRGRPRRRRRKRRPGEGVQGVLRPRPTGHPRRPRGALRRLGTNALQSVAVVVARDSRTHSSRARRTHPRTSSSGVRSPPRSTRRAPSSASPR